MCEIVRAQESLLLAPNGKEENRAAGSRRQLGEQPSSLEKNSDTRCVVIGAVVDLIPVFRSSRLELKAAREISIAKT